MINLTVFQSTVFPIDVKQFFYISVFVADSDYGLGHSEDHAAARFHQFYFYNFWFWATSCLNSRVHILLFLHIIFITTSATARARALFH